MFMSAWMPTSWENGVAMTGIAHLGPDPNRLLEQAGHALGHVGPRQLVAQGAHHPSGELGLEDREPELGGCSGGPSLQRRDCREVVGYGIQAARVEADVVPEAAHVVDAHLRGGHRGPAGERRGGGVQDADPLLDAYQVIHRSESGRVVEVELERNVAAMALHQRDPGMGPLDAEHSGLVAEDDRLDRRLLGELGDHPRVVLVGMHRRVAEGDLRRRRDAVRARHAGHFLDLPRVVQAVEDPDASNAVLCQGPEPQLDHRIGCDRHSHDPVRPHARAQRRARQGRPHRVEPRPRVDAPEAHQHLEVRAAGNVDRVVSGRIDQIRHGEHVARLHAHPPVALLAVPQRLVDVADLRHESRARPARTTLPGSGLPSASAWL